MRHTLPAWSAAVIGLAALAALGAGPASRPTTVPANARADAKADAKAAVVAAKARLSSAEAELAKKVTEVTARLERSPAYRSAKAEADAAAVRWAQAKVDGSPQERIDASTADSAARAKLARLRDAALAADGDYERLRQAVADAEEQEKAAEEEARPKPAPPFASLLATLPAEARPEPDKSWDEFCTPKAHKFLNQRYPGQRVSFQLRLKAVRIVRIPDPKDRDETIGWQMAVSLEPSRVALFRTPTFTSCATRLRPKDARSGWKPGQVQLDVPESLASDAREWRVGDLISLEGTVLEIAAEHPSDAEGQDRGVFTAVVGDVTFTGHAAAPAPPKSPGR